ncbi:Fructose-bisphosphate aldolase A [Sarcoptes scabiei]|uniref:Fructose-bisphosphate aldolase n=1 Tax=Sarcoptes scabiei TaxID=52283 RepID=A0A132A4V7_SARSC|nr:Fructose-bisphosphate aldolase A [Sarcoptes scabiei]KPM05983.1 fructose 1,6-bisphosphate aldolase-like protein [Sarcoptes scabiei]UXI14343.1 hypothetical protein NH340_JMT00286 [Sarcoptes scabiei]UXI14344.1 hypothetical protein NH340_JMT00287 [Sarcoptes scabiei]UXI14345.1 hypothetical protein NH340_JMT00288 [Sarcoptes scabiei]
MSLILSRSIQKELHETATAIARPGKGILAADESFGSIEKKFSTIGIENTPENRRLYRQLLLCNSEISQFISGVILHEETIYQKDDEGNLLINVLRRNSIIPGVKVDKGVVPLLGCNYETATQGLDDLKSRCQVFYRLGCRFAKWRAVFRIGDIEPSTIAIEENVKSLARYAAICQENRIVPIVEPDILQDGKHDIEKCQLVSQKIFSSVINALHQYNVCIEGILLKLNMITSGYDCSNKSTPEEIGLATITTLLRTCPPAIPGILFLSGGQSEEEATTNLNAINKAIKCQGPWTLSFSFGRALQQSALHVWNGKSENVSKAQEALLKRMKANSLASLGKYVPGLISFDTFAEKSNFIAKHSY